MWFVRGGSARFSYHFFLTLSFIALVAGCGKDASIQLTKPDPVTVKTKRVHFSLESAEPGNIGAELIHPSGTLEMDDVGQRAFDLPIGHSLEVKLKLEDGWEVKKWNILPGGNVDPNIKQNYFKISNVQDDTQISVSVGKKEIPKIETKTVYLKIESPEKETVIADVVSLDDPFVFRGPGERVIDLPTTDDLNVTLTLPDQWEVEKWTLSAAADYDDPGKGTNLIVKRIKSDLHVTAKVRRIPHVAPPETKTVYFKLESPEKETFVANVGSLEKALTFSGTGERALDLPTADDLSISLNLPEQWEIEKWSLSAPAEYDDPGAGTHLLVKRVKKDLHVTAKVRRVPHVPPPQTKTVYLKIEAPEKGKVFADIASIEKSLVFLGDGERIIDLLASEDLKIALTLPQHWEVQKWTLSSDAEYDEPGTGRKLVVRRVPGDLHVTVKLRKVPFFTFKVRVAGTSFLNGDIGSGLVKWKAYRPTQQPADNFEFGDDEVDSSLGIENIDKASPKVLTFPNGTKLRVKYTFTDSTDRLRTLVDTIVLDENKTLDVDYHKIIGVDFSGKSPGFYQALEIDPKAKQEIDPQSSENRE